MISKEIHKVYFVGIGGIGMSALARYFVSIGKQVLGYDKTPSQITNQLETLGVAVHFDEDVSVIPSNDLTKENTLVVYTPAVPATHTELQYFKSHDFQVLKRAAVLGEITKHSFCLAVAGTHGKTTTSSILGHIMSAVNATAFLGGIAENYDSNLILGEGTVSVMEADEFDRSFLQLSPNIACITSMDADHLDIYGQHDALLESFQDFADKVSGEIIVAKGLPIKGLTYAVDEEADYMATNLKIENGKYCFDVKTPTNYVKDVQFHLPGRHNVMNALAAFAMADVYGVAHEQIKDKLKSFAGVQRRFSYPFQSEERILIDDYAHHPTEINAVSNAVREMYPNEKVMVIFQPHLFSRTKDFADDFATSLSKFDEIRLLDIYPARELPMEGINSEWLLDKIENTHKKLVQKSEVLDEIVASEAKIIAMLGAGDIGVLVKEVVNGLKSEVHGL
ncbi:MAG: UDP-N-acetylmuramate--L-alanine ligase [Flavobacteriaceae bacterium]|nr:UDP-N-acetylmuramate--L-alanine ligase [Flavobacteriaceae bacterium]|tara:strand:- start:23199 stop:24548 length:1350 start_codon:yes stop_codon:yes gene_type:complete